jgi:23S rRNA pseudouridine2605 synthase
MSEPKKDRIAKRLSMAGVCSRREAERWIAEGRVAVDGVVLTSPAFTVSRANEITVDGNPLPGDSTLRMWQFHKRRGLITTHSDPQGRPTVFQSLPNDLPRVVSVGRLDLNSEGLLLLTTQGRLARQLELPSTGWIRRYRVRVFGHPEPRQLATLAKGVTIDGIKYGPVTANLDSTQGANSWLTVSLTEGKNREVRRLMEHLELNVSRLIRTAFGPFQLGHLKPGEVREVSGKVIREQLGDLSASAR